MEVLKSSYLDVLTLLSICFVTLIVSFLVWRIVCGGLRALSDIYKKGQYLNEYIKNWHLYTGEPYLRVEDEKSGEFAALSHEQKIKFLQDKYALKPRKLNSQHRFALIMIAGLFSLVIAGSIVWVYGENDKVVGSLAPLAVTAFVALFIWFFRDENNVYQLERQHHDVTLKEFQKLQEWATGNIADGYLLEESTEELEFSYSGIRQKKEKKIKKSQKLTQTKQAETLQIMALHSLRPYLKGEFGEIFKRGAFEIYTSVLKTEHQKIFEKFELQRKPMTFENIQSAINAVPLAKQINQIASEEWFCLLVNHDFPTAGTSLLGVDLEGCYLRYKVFSKGLSFEKACLIGTNLSKANLVKANLRGAKLFSAKLNEADLKCSTLINAKLHCSELKKVNLMGVSAERANFLKADMKEAKMQGASLIAAQFQGADLYQAQLQGTDIWQASFEGARLVKTDLSSAHMKSVWLKVKLYNRNPPVDRIYSRVEKKPELSIELSEEHFSDGFEIWKEMLIRDLKGAISLTALNGLFGSIQRRKGIPDFHLAIQGSYSLDQAKEWIKEIESSC